MSRAKRGGGSMKGDGKKIGKCVTGGGPKFLKIA